MRTIAFDGRTGASGDMLLGTLLAAGADRDRLGVVERGLPLRYDVRSVTKRGIAATAVDVLREDGVPDAEEAADPDHDRSREDHRNGGEDRHRDGHDRDDHDQGGHDRDGHNHDSHDRDGHNHDGHNHDGQDRDDHDHVEHDHDGHVHERRHDQGDDRDDGRVHAEGRGPHRTYGEVVEIVESMAVPPRVERDALDVFELLGKAEASVHGTDLPETRFHEVGADDAIADVVGVCLLVDDLDPERIVTTPLATGSGEVTMSHGAYPVPAPAVIEITERADWSIRGGPVETELLTPTGAALLAHFAEGVERLPDLRVERSGYGAGDADFASHPNVLRTLVGESRGGLTRDEITVLETNVDDAAPETLGGLQGTLADAGARDVSILPATMKKSRPGHLVKVVVKPEDAERVARRLAEETGTLGVREHGVGHRWIAGREVVTATIEEDGRHEVRVKLGTDEAGAVFDVSAEHDDALAVARETGLPVREVARRAEAAVRDGRAERLVHIAEKDRWAEFADADAYTHPSLDSQGFVHLSTPAQALGVAQTNYADAADPRLLVIDPGRVSAEIKYEEQPTGGCAHVYGPIDAEAIVDVLAFPREDGRFVLPDELGD